jgi:predicted RND superfamily exporter protein
MLAIALSFFSTLAISIYFKIMLGQGLNYGIAVVGAATFVLWLGVILLVQRWRGAR